MVDKSLVWMVELWPQLCPLLLHKASQGFGPLRPGAVAALRMSKTFSTSKKCSSFVSSVG